MVPRVRNKGSRTVRNGRAFTLIELLVVISIIVLLMALLFPVLSRARKQARAVVCQSRERNWSIMFAAYQNEHDGRFPDGTYSTWDEGQEDLSYYHVPWACHMEVYSGSDLRDAMLCPSTPTAVPPGTFHTRGKEVAAGTTFVAWRFDCDGEAKAVMRVSHATYAGSYATNNFLCDFWTNTRERFQLGKVAPADLPTFFDCRVSRTALNDGCSEEPPPYEDCDFEASVSIYATALAINRHQEGVNTVFLDGAIRKVGVKELWTLKWHHDYDTAGPWTKAGGVLPEDWPAWMHKFKDY
ncbi:MAG: type II secretion system protein [Phycisphaerae bacterium]|nr:type II secretion system protein [Phycisphaerae bacterium]